MKTLEDLVAFVDLVLSPGFDVAAAQRRLGTIDRWQGTVALVADSDPTLFESAIETSDGVLTGVVTHPRPRLAVPWSELRRALGDPIERAFEVDNFTGRRTYLFAHEAPGGQRGVVGLYAKRDEDPAQIDQVIVRPATPA
jgi:hypothetical protein